MRKVWDGLGVSWGGCVCVCEMSTGKVRVVCGASVRGGSGIGRGCGLGRVCGMELGLRCLCGVFVLGEVGWVCRFGWCLEWGG